MWLRPRTQRPSQAALHSAADLVFGKFVVSLLGNLFSR
jgi:hypothetical protein